VIDYDAIANDALAALAEAGALLPCVRTTNNVDPVTEVVSVETLAGDFVGVLLPAKRNPFTVSMDSADVENLRTGKAKRLLLAASGAPFIPITGDVFTVGVETYRLTGVTTLAPNGTPVIFTTEALKL